MANRYIALLPALVAGGMAAAACAQDSPDANPPVDAAPDVPAPPHWQIHRPPPPPPAWDDDERDVPGHASEDWRLHEHRFGHPGAEFRQLDLTPEQHRRMEIIVLNARLQELQQRDAHQPAPEDEFAALMNPGDPNYAAAVQEARKRAAEHVQRMSELRLQLYNVLTPEQKAEFSRRIAQRHERMRAHGEPADFRGPPAPAAR